MRSDIVPGGTFPDYGRPDHEGHVRRLNCPKEHQQHLELAARDAGDLSRFHGWNRRAKLESVPDTA
jgi:hypothetical protein